MKTTKPNLDGCREKRRRAGEHFQALDKALYDWLGEPGVDKALWTMRGEFRPDKGEFAFVGRMLKRPDEVLRWGVILGDAIHNIRSALDQLVWQLVLLNGKMPSRANQFPICDTPEDYLGNGGKRKGKRRYYLEGVLGDHKKLIDRHQPYRDRPAGASPDAIHPLSAVRELSNTDKHQVIHWTDFAVDFPSMEAMDEILVPNADAGERARTRYGPMPYGPETDVFAALYTCPGPDPDVSFTGLPPLTIGMSDLRLRFPEIAGGSLGVLDQILSEFKPVFPRARARSGRSQKKSD